MLQVNMYSNNPPPEDEKSSIQYMLCYDGETFNEIKNLKHSM
jgi:hypothetical protein